jgi:hypothetical protein
LPDKDSGLVLPEFLLTQKGEAMGAIVERAKASPSFAEEVNPI